MADAEDDGTVNVGPAVDSESDDGTVRINDPVAPAVRVRRRQPVDVPVSGTFGCWLVGDLDVPPLGDWELEEPLPDVPGKRFVVGAVECAWGG